MKLTNKFNIPQTIVNVLQRPTYNKGKAHLSVTQLINSPKIVALTSKYDDEIEQDAAGMVWSLFGSAIHNILEHGKDHNHVVEQRIHAEIDGWNVSGAVDLQIVNNNGITIKDWKTTSVWAVMNEKIEWEYQLNIYAWLVEKTKNVPVTDLGIVAILRDWKEREVGTKEGYPEAPIKELPITLWTMEEREEFIKARISAHSECDFALETNGSLPDCTKEEMWEKPAVWAVKKTGNKRAHSLYDTPEKAMSAVAELGDAYDIEHRPGERTRCESYCAVNQWCKQYQDYKEQQLC
jgi:hypothetical protein